MSIALSDGSVVAEVTGPSEAMEELGTTLADQPVNVMGAEATMEESLEEVQQDDHVSCGFVLPYGPYGQF